MAIVDPYTYLLINRLHIWDITLKVLYLVGGWATPLKKYELVSWDDFFEPQYSWENAKFMFQPFTTNQKLYRYI